MLARELDILLEIARTGSFAGAARSLDLDPSAVSRTVASVERQLGARLFQRTTRRVAPTEAGARYLRRIEGVAEELRRATAEVRDVAGVARGTVRITASVAFGVVVLAPLIPQLRQRHPELAVDLVLSDGTLDLVEHRIDLAVRLAPGIEGDLIRAKLMDTRYRVCAAPGRSLAVPSDLSGQECLLQDLPDYRSVWRFRDHAGLQEEVPVSGSIVASNPLALKALAVSGQGIGLFADWLVAEDLADGRLVDLFPHHDVTATSFETAAWLVYPSRDFLPAKVRAVIDLLRDRLGRGR
jgi:DNA-binding transcriptional LysR family regulator